MRIGWIRTFTGMYVCLASPDPQTITIRDIAHHLSIEGRWGGATARHYSVAEHCIWVAAFIRVLFGDTRLAIVHALLHDAHEAYIKDIPTPLKRILGEGYERMAAGLDNAIWASVGVPPPTPDLHTAIVLADQYAAWCEAKVLMAPCAGIQSGKEPPAALLNEVWMLSDLRRPRNIETVEYQYANMLKYALSRAS